MMFKTLTSIAVLLSLVSKSSAIYCFYCNSANNSACLNPSDYDDETRVRLIPIINCDAAVPMVKPIHFFCRKIVQTIYRYKHESEFRVTRGCGWVTDEKPCYKAKSEDYVETVCQCFTDYCNSADVVNPNTATALFVLLAIVLYFYQ